MAKVNVLHTSGTKFCFEIDVGGKVKKYTATIHGTNQEKVLKKVQDFTKKFLEDLGEKFEAEQVDFSKIHLRKMNSSGIHTKVDQKLEEEGENKQKKVSQKFEEITPFVEKVNADKYSEDFGLQNEKIKAQAKKILEIDSESESESSYVKDGSSFTGNSSGFTKDVWQAVCAIDSSPQASPIRNRQLNQSNASGGEDHQDGSGSADHQTILVNPVLPQIQTEGDENKQEHSIHKESTGVASLDENNDDDGVGSDDGSIAVSMHTATSNEVREMEQDEELDEGGNTSTLQFPISGEQIPKISSYQFLGLNADTHALDANQSYIDYDSKRETLNFDRLEPQQIAKYHIYSGAGHLTENLKTISALPDFEQCKAELNALLKLLFQLIHLHSAKTNTSSSVEISGEIQENLKSGLEPKQFEHEIPQTYSTLAQTYIKSLVQKEAKKESWILAETVTFDLTQNQVKENLLKLKNAVTELSEKAVIAE